jgi:hypothetical protein
VRYHQTDVVMFDADYVVLNSGGWRTATTKLRMNQASRQFNLGYTVTQYKREWFVRYHCGENWARVPFRDNMTVPVVPLKWTGEEWIPAS